MSWAPLEAAVTIPTTVPLASEQRSAAVAGIDRRVGLDQAGQILGEVRRAVADGDAPVHVRETIPDVTESVNVPSGLPMAIASWPTWMVEESPRVTGVRPVALTWIRARS